MVQGNQGRNDSRSSGTQEQELSDKQDSSGCSLSLSNSLFPELRHCSLCGFFCPVLLALSCPHGLVSTDGHFLVPSHGFRRPDWLTLSHMTNHLWLRGIVWYKQDHRRSSFVVNLAPFSKSRSVGWEDILSGVCTLSKFPAATEKNTYVGGKVISSLRPAKPWQGCL